ncbi:hypothetical protein L3Y19_gp057 [Gordonia phage Neville]|uniref:Uncharacterized protein n=2 Tax=Nevillevirus TaxID=3044773 RepID=A0A515MGZ1_9CAUD|nr:hypothetical protein L3Y19_gp057 [Gordonia phage Neville]YP_010246041.1 hypothetical protein L3Y20_gp056 [Gordonia phage Trax]AXQ64426.1 hypothetical protein SEA_NEVILLE_57 [Gordonia phage Neville]QDM55943.1 hypothetical protein SEA_TRAX_56 [Gordonia phage Trax]
MKARCIKSGSGYTLLSVRTSPAKAFVVLEVPTYPHNGTTTPERVWLDVANSKRLRKALKKAEKKTKP